MTFCVDIETGYLQVYQLFTIFSTDSAREWPKVVHTHIKSGASLKFGPRQTEAQNLLQPISQNQIMNCRRFSLSHS
jgi:hypothetical protein